MSAAPKPDDTRAHSRYFLRNSHFARVRFANNQSYPLRDLSYTGFSIDHGLDRMSSDQVRIEVLDSGVDATAKLVHSNGKLSGFSFLHRSVETLIYLQPIIERIRIGRTMQALPQEMIEEKYRAGNWVILRGDGPSDLKVKFKGEEIEAMILTFREGERYTELRLRDGKLYTTKQIDSQGVSARVGETTTLDRSIARYAICVLAGLQEPKLAKALATCLGIYTNPT